MLHFGGEPVAFCSSPHLRREIGDPNQGMAARHRKCNTLSNRRQSGAICFKALRKKRIE
jgi:hypothetical protein